ncbi:AsmA family protein [Ideonella sp. BN130291]|uniref:AsmA family protein n=1 Tax=Ideonella sp. BN130291 TaxID=3112940 RepID=UPI002E259321|nr:AsmA family protein [Ideonella sp. BN130291]
MKPLPTLRAHPVLTGLGLLLLTLVVAFALCEWRGWPFLRQPLQNTLSKRLDRDVQVGQEFDLHLLGALRVRSDSLHVGPPRWAPQGPNDRFFDAREVFLELPWSTLWNLAVTKEPRPLQVSALEVGSFDAVLWRRADGHANWEFQLPKKKTDQPADLPEFDRLLVRNGRLSLDDAPTTLKLRAEASTSEGQAAGGESGLQIKGDGHYREGDFNFTMRSNGVLPLIAGKSADMPPVPITLQGKTPNGHVKFEGQARDIIHLEALTGSFRIGGTSLAKVGEPFGVTLPTTAPFESQGKLAKDGQVWKADIANFKVGSSQLAGEFAFDRRQAVPLLTGVLRGRNLDLKDLGPAFGNPAPGTGNPAKPSGRVFPDREFDIPSLQQMNADVRVDLARADLHTALLEPLSPLRGRIRLQNGVLSVDQLVATTSGGEVQGRLALDGRQVKSPRWNGDLRIAGVRLEQWLRMRNKQAKPETTSAMGKTPATTYVSGSLGGRIQFTGSGRSVADMVSSLDGTIAAWVNDGRVSHLALEAAGIDIAQALGVLVRGDDSLPMQCAVTQFTARNGELHADVGLIDTEDTTMIINGDVSLAKEQLALVAHANPKDFSPIALRSPIHLEGSFSKPHVRLETKPIAMKAVAAVVLGAINPLAALIPLVDPGKKVAVGCQQALEHLRGTRARGVEPPKVQAAGTSGALKPAIQPAAAPKARAPSPNSTPGGARH